MREEVTKEVYKERDKNVSEIYKLEHKNRCLEEELKKLNSKFWKYEENMKALEKVKYMFRS